MVAAHLMWQRPKPRVPLLSLLEGEGSSIFLFLHLTSSWQQKVGPVWRSVFIRAQGQRGCTVLQFFETVKALQGFA